MPDPIPNLTPSRKGLYLVLVCLALAALGLGGHALMNSAQSPAKPAPSLASPNKKGEKIYKQCVACHIIGENPRPHIGPHLNTIIGRKIASIKGYKYSKAMVAYAKENPIWTEKLLDAYLENPRKAMPGTRMAFSGLRKPEDRQNLLTYLKSTTP